MNKVPRWVFRYVGNKTFDFFCKKNFLPKNGAIWPKIVIFVHFWPGLAAHLVPCCLVVVARGLYLARHLFTLFVDPTKAYLIFDILTLSIVGLWIISRGSEKMNVFSNQIPALSQSISQVKIQIMERLTL